MRRAAVLFTAPPVSPIVLAAGFVVAAMTVPVWGEERYDRIAQNANTSHVITVAAGLSVHLPAGGQTARQPAIIARSALTYSYRERLYVELSVPLHVRPVFDVHRPPRTLRLVGDPTAAIRGRFSVGAVRFLIRAGYSPPLGVWNPYQVLDTGLRSSSGGHQVALTASAARITDPVVLSGSVGAAATLRRQGRYTTKPTLWRMRCGCAVTEVLNDEVSIALVGAVEAEVDGSVTYGADTGLILAVDGRDLRVKASFSLRHGAGGPAPEFSLELAYDILKL